MPLPTKEELSAKYGPGKAPVMTRADVEHQRAQNEKWWAEVEEEGRKKEQANIRRKAQESLSSNYATGDDNLGIQDNVTRSTHSIYGSLKSAKKRKRDINTDDGVPLQKAKSGASSAPTLLDSNENFTPTSYAPAKKGPRRNDAAYSTIVPVDTRRLANSAWYNSINTKAKYGRTDLVTLQRLVDSVKRHERELGHVLQQMPLHKFLSGVLIKKSKVLEDQGLPAIFDNQEEVDLPFDIKADALAIYNRWIVGDIDGHLLRFIKTEKAVLESGKRRTAHKLEPGYDKKSSNVIGDNGLVNGQWWPSRLCLMRDPAHGEVEAGISGQTGRGAFSIVVSGGGYADDDQGEVIRYCGTESDNSTPTKNTNLMLEAEANDNQVRLFRSEKKDSRYAPKKGIRYDGLYVITGHEILNKATRMYRFRLERCPGQDPIRYQGVEARPNEFELRDAANLKELLSGMA